MHKLCNQRQPTGRLLDEMVTDSVRLWQGISDAALREACKEAMARSNGFVPSPGLVLQAYRERPRRERWVELGTEAMERQKNALAAPGAAPPHPDEAKAWIEATKALYPFLAGKE